MSTESLILSILIAILVATISFFLTHRHSQQVIKKLETSVALKQQAIETQAARLTELTTEKRHEVEEHKANCEHWRNKAVSQESDVREREATIKAEKEKLAALKVQFDQQKSELKNEFKLVSDQISQAQQKHLNQQNKEGIGALLKPLQEQIVSFQKRVNEVHTEAVKGNTKLEAEIEKVMDLGLKMRDEASNLSSALKGNSQQRGAWGEAQLERTLEMSGLMETAHYEKQSLFKDQFGKNKQTDYLVKLPGNKHIIIDSKVSLIAYDEAVSAKTDAERALAMDKHVKSVKKHIDDLAAKDYTNLVGMHSPSFVLMFMPIEPAYIEALKHNKSMFGYGYDKSIVLVSHTTLIPILRTVANLWKVDQGNNEAREIIDKAGDIYNSVCTVTERFQKLGNTLNTASVQYNGVVTALSGRQGLQGKVERFTQVSNKASKKIPELEPRHFEYETSRLDIQALALEQDQLSATSLKDP